MRTIRRVSRHLNPGKWNTLVNLTRCHVREKDARLRAFGPDARFGNCASGRARRDTFRLYGVKVDIGSSSVRSMRAVQPMPKQVWEAAERRLARLRGEQPAPVSDLVKTVQGSLTTMGYACEPPGCQSPLVCFRCRPQGGGLKVAPIFLRTDEHIRGLMFLLSIVLRAFTLIEFVVRREL